MDNQNFCVQCGELLAPEARFCPACGTRVPGRNPEQVEAEKQAVRDVMKARLNWAIALMLIYSIPFLIIGIYISVDLDGLANMIMTDPLYADFVDYYGLTYDQRSRDTRTFCRPCAASSPPSCAGRGPCTGSP